jgi:Zn-dependent protease with chaperone function
MGGLILGNSATKYIDTRTGRLKYVEDGSEKLESAIIKGAHFSILAAKYALAMPAVAAAGMFGIGYASYHALAKASIQNKLDKFLDGKEKVYDLGVVNDRDTLYRRYPDMAQVLVRDFPVMADMAGLQKLPRIVISAEQPTGIAVNMKNKNPVLIISQDDLEDKDADELRVMIAHELTHCREKHILNMVSLSGKKMLDWTANAALLVMAVTGNIPLLPAAVMIVGGTIACKLLSSASTRQNERIADKGALLLTGDAAAMASATNDGGYYASLSPLKPFFMDHPSGTLRAQAAHSFKNANPELCRLQSERFQGGFNKAAQKPKKSLAFPSMLMESSFQHANYIRRY